jgi:N-acylneuraminate cytidylyltransferase
MTRDVIAIVPIKEHSERLPKKNFREFNGRPLYHWILDTLGSVPEIDQIVVNTDANEVMTEAPKHFDVEISERPQYLREDETTTRIIEHEVDRTDADLYMHTYCTCPLLKVDTISRAIRTFIDNEENDAVLPVTSHKKRFYDADLKAVNHDPQNVVPTQDLSPVYEENSTLFVYTAETLKRTGSRIGENPLPVEINEREAIEIDYPPDFELAEALHAQQLESDDRE